MICGRWNAYSADVLIAIQSYNIMQVIWTILRCKWCHSGSEYKFCKPISNSSRVRDIHFRANIFGPGNAVLETVKTRWAILNKNKISLDRFRKTRTVYPSRLNKVFSLKFSESYLNRQTRDEGRRLQLPKHCDNNKKDEDSSAICK